MDNQQETLIINDNYIAGLLDSDFGVYICKNTYKGKIQYTPRIKFINTRFKLVEVCSNKLLEYGINHYVSISKATKGKDAKYLIIQRLTKCVDFVNRFKNLSVGRSKQLELIGSFCESRLRGISEGNSNKFSKYSTFEDNIFKELTKLNYNYNVDFSNRNLTYSWLAGMIDGDGSIFITKTKRSSKYKKTNGEFSTYSYIKYLPVLKITTESTAVYNNVITMYTNLNINYYVEKAKSKVSKKLGRNLHKILYNITITNFNDLEVILNKLFGKLVGKQKQLELMQEFILEKRINKHNTEKIAYIVSNIKDLNINY
jgi:hypothetical protein